MIFEIVLVVIFAPVFVPLLVLERVMRRFRVDRYGEQPQGPQEPSQEP